MLFADAVGILDNSGNIVVKYAYDAYGNCKVVSGADSEIATLNPFRYRGYYYDRETGLYYLNARYYNPEWRRFISPDDISYIDPQTPNGLNLYAYCNNDPVNYADPSGHWIDTAIDVISICWSAYDLITEPSIKNAAWLLLDIVFAAVPFLTGGPIMKAAAKLEDVADKRFYMYTAKLTKLKMEVAFCGINYIVSTVGSSMMSDHISNHLEGYYYGY